MVAAASRTQRVTISFLPVRNGAARGRSFGPGFLRVWARVFERFLARLMRAGRGSRLEPSSYRSRQFPEHSQHSGGSRERASRGTAAWECLLAMRHSAREKLRRHTLAPQDPPPGPPADIAARVLDRPPTSEQRIEDR